jgi:hypothetical protein
MAAVLVMARLCEPSSELHIAEDWFRRMALDDRLGLPEAKVNDDRLDRAWERITLRDGEKGPLVVDAMSVRVRAQPDGRIGPEGRLVVIRPVGESRIDYALSNAGAEVPLAEVVGTRGSRSAE